MDESNSADLSGWNALPSLEYVPIEIKKLLSNTPHPANESHHISKIMKFKVEIETPGK